MENAEESISFSVTVTFNSYLHKTLALTKFGDTEAKESTKILQPAQTHKNAERALTNCNSYVNVPQKHG